MQRIGIVGARKYKDRPSVIALVHSLPQDAIVITSSCRGVCTWTGEAARASGLTVRIYAPNLDNIKNRAEMVERYYHRNRQLITACDIVHAFISQEAGLTGGTRYEVEYAKRLNKDLFLHWEHGRTERIGQIALPFKDIELDLSAGWKSIFADALA